MRTLRAWLRRMRRRQGGVYVWRTDKHGAPGRRENGYVGESGHIPRRDRDHRGQTAYARRVTRKNIRQAKGLPDVDVLIEQTTQKPWMDLRAKRYTLIALPWWLNGKWIRRPLETLAIALLWPRYNHAKNLWNPRRVPLSVQKRQRAERDERGPRQLARVQLAVVGWMILRGLGVACLLVGLGGWMVTR